MTPIAVLGGLLLALASIHPARAATPHHTVSLTLQPESGELEATDRITSFEPGTPIIFELAPGLEVTDATIGGTPVDVTRSGGRWRVNDQVGADQVLSLSYTGRLPEEVWLGADGGVLPGSLDWLPHLGNDRITFEIEVRTPDPFVAVATGDLVGETRSDDGYEARFRADEPSAPPSLFIGPYVIGEHRTDHARIRTYFYPDQADLAPTYLEQTATYLERYSELIGDYPYRDFHVVAAPLPVGLGFPRTTYVARQILHLPFMQTRSLAHEVLHSWWGNAVAVDYGSGNWAEGLTTYMADYALEGEKGAEDAHAMRLAWLQDFAALPPERDQPLRSFVTKEHDAAQVIGYDKAAFVFHMLHQQSGDDGFKRAIQRFWQQHRFETAGWADLQQAFEDVLGEPLGPVFAQWIDRPGAPRLRLDAANAAPTASGYQALLRIGQDTPPYALQVPVEIETTNGVTRVTAAIEATSTELIIRTDAEPVAVAVDPDHDVFRQLAPGEAPPILRDVTLGGRVALVLPPAPDDFVATARELAGRLVDGAVELASERDPLPAESPVLIIGQTAPVREALQRLGLPPAPVQLANAGTARVWVARADTVPAVLVVEADDQAALDALLRPLPHYGRKSFLVFEGSRAVETGLWPAGDNPLRRKLG